MQKSKKKSYSFKLFLMILPFLILVILFSYYPLYGWMYAFYDYKPPRTLANSQFVGFKWFVSLVNNPVKVKQIAQVMKNTFAMSGLTIGTNWLPMLFAVFLNEIRGVKFRKFVQTVTTLPNFVSWILVYSIAFSLFNSDGMMNSFLMKLGWIDQPILFLQQSNHVWLTQWFWLTWKNLGWAAIMYVAAISNIDNEMIEAAKIDGANSRQMLRYITIPTLAPTITICTFLSLTNGFKLFDQNLALTAGQPISIMADGTTVKQTEMLALNIYNTFYGQSSASQGTAQAKAVLFFILVAALGLLQLAYTRKREVQQ